MRHELNTPIVRSIIFFLSVLALLYIILLFLITTFGSPLETDVASLGADVSLLDTAEITEQSLDELFIGAQQATQSQNWQGAYERLARIRAADSTYKSSEVQALLADAYFNAGVTAAANTSGDTAEVLAAQSLLEQAVAADPENLKIRQSLDELTLFTTGLSALETGDLQRTVDILQPLYTSAPDYLRSPVGRHLSSAYKSIGEMAAGQGNQSAATYYFGLAQGINEGAD